MPSDVITPAVTVAAKAGPNAGFLAQSYLFVPGNKPERFDKALGSGADAVIIDLEDAVAPSEKLAAREAIAQWVSRKHPVLIRINARTTPWFEADAALGALDGVAGIVIPKAESAEDVCATVAIARRRLPIYPLIESGLGMWNALEIAKAPYVKRLMFGTLDFIADMGMTDDGLPLNHHRANLALISRVAGIESPIDGVTPDIQDDERIEREAFNGKQLGFGAKLCIHPRQIEFVHRCFRPGEAEVRWAKRVVAAMHESDGGVVTVDGKMVDRPVLLRATRIVALNEAVECGQNGARADNAK
ncbi:HpcH/HpaI aldolase/citrate lyase family protein [Burkholderia sp. Ac-20379]|uniref:HpcH/HpaI aldolase/citrate lyase family protein n=1 Tax=Burkholderia sp. Ac-20379 TaxID=2703900 RepID=UPI00197CD8C9|nr:CoA ester lyase [Burkholderia sp. Ac-20379]MBN3722685.1 CoA ester lyase [Burkholderia sp. Ac-20379]